MMSGRIKEIMRLAGATMKISTNQSNALETITQVDREQTATLRSDIPIAHFSDNVATSSMDTNNLGQITQEKGTKDDECSDIIDNSVSSLDFEINPSCLLSHQRMNLRDQLPGPSYVYSPQNSGESEADLSDSDPSYENNDSAKPRQKVIPDSSSSGSTASSSSSSDSSSDSDSEPENEADNQGVMMAQENLNNKRVRSKKSDPQMWKQNKVQKLRNSGQPYTSLSKTSKSVPGRSLKTSCKCRLKCLENINEESRLELFNGFWQLANLYKQRAFIGSSLVDIQPKYRYSNAANPRHFNQAYYFTVNSKKIRVCKTFFKNTLNITDRMIQTAKSKYDENGILQEDLRGRHENHKKISDELLNDIRNHINSIPRIESHYLRANTSKEYIDGSKTITDLYKDFKIDQLLKSKDSVKFCTYYKVFTTEFNLGFFKPKKDQCDMCMTYANATPEQREPLESQLEIHLKQKDLSRIEKTADRQKVSPNYKVVVYDLQAVMQCPNGDTSSFYYKSKLNSYNFTMTDLTKKDDNDTQNHNHKKKDSLSYDKVNCYFWSETDGKRGANEIGSCVLNYLENIGNDVDGNIDVTFYSDNCCGQNKNKYITTMYLFAVHCFNNLQSITHKFLIKGHSQNEADNVHSLIEREIKKNLKSGPIYCPQQYVPLIKNAKKNKSSFVVHELTYDFFKDLKSLQEEWGYNYNINDEGESVVWNDIRIMRFTKEDPFVFYYKTSYDQKEYSRVSVRNKRKRMPVLSDISLRTLNSEKQKLAENKKKDLRDLIAKNLIPNFYVDFYNTIL